MGMKAEEIRNKTLRAEGFNPLYLKFTKKSP